MYHDLKQAEDAQDEFDKIFVKKEIPENIESYIFKESTEIGIIDLILEVGFAPSKEEARRLVQQGGVSIDGNKITDIQSSVKIENELVLKVGKRKFMKLLIR
jgi:tyrosyl-tRNA synthetase